MLLFIFEDLRQKMYNEVIRDCDDCLELDPTNIKAMFRQCDALIATDRRNAAYKRYTNILNIEPENEFAKKALNDISLRYDIQTREIKSIAIRKSESSFGLTF